MITTLRSGVVMSLALLGVLVAFTSTARAQVVPLTISGGNGSQLTFTLGSPITFTVGITPINNSNNSPFFVFQGAGNLNGGFSFSSAPAFTATHNGSSLGTFTMSAVQSNQTFGAITNNDLWFYASSPGVTLQIGDVVTLNAGTFTTAGTYSGTLSSGSFNTMLTDGNGNNLSAVPEPSTYAALMGLGVLAFGAWRRRRAAACETTAG